MKLLLRFRRAVFAVLVAAASVMPGALVAQIVDDPVTVPVQFQGMFDAVATGDPDLPAYLNVVPFGGGVTYAAAYGQSAGGANQTTGGGFARLRPGKTYLFEITTFSTTKARVKITPPSGHRVFINGDEHELFEWTKDGGAQLDPQGFFSVRLDDGSGAAVGEADSLRPGRVLWSVGLGALRNGKPAGSLRIAENGLTANTFKPLALFFDRDAGNQDGRYAGDDFEAIVVKSSGVLSQVYTGAVLAVIAEVNDHAYTIKLFPRDQVTDPGSPSLFTVVGDPLFEYLIENPNYPNLDQMRVTKFVRQNGTLTMWTEMTKSTPLTGFTQWMVHDWVDKQPTDTAVSSPVRHRWTYSDGDKSEHLRIEDAAGTVARAVFKRYEDWSFGVETARELYYEIQGCNTDPYTTAANAETGTSIKTTYTYHTSFSSDYWGNWHKIATVDGNDGSRAVFSYKNDFDSRGQIFEIRRPHKDTAPSDPGAGSNGEITTFSYDFTDNFGAKRMPTSIETRVNGTLAARSEISYAYEYLTDASNTYSPATNAEMTLTVATRKDYYNATQYLTTITRTYREDSDPQRHFFRSLPHSVERPDKSITAMVYFNVSYTPQYPFFWSQTGGGRAHVALQGTSSATYVNLAGSTVATVPMTAYGVAAQPLPASFRVVAGKSSETRSLMGVTGVPGITERSVFVPTNTWLPVQQDWFDYANLIWPSLVRRRTEANSATPLWDVVSNTWAAGRLSASVDETGVSQSFGYDSVGRVQTVTRTGATYGAATIAAQTVTQAYDAAGAVTSRTTTAAGETIGSSAMYDTAGRVTSQTASGQGTTSIAYDVASRITTMTLPTTYTQVETRWRDGGTASVTGTAMVPQYFDVTVESDGRRRSKVSARTSTDVRKQEAWADWLGRAVRRERPTFQNAATFVETIEYDSIHGKPTKSTRTGYGDLLVQYNELGEQKRSGLDLNGVAGLDLASIDRITDTESIVESFDNAYWLTSTTAAFHENGTNATKISGITRQRLNGLNSSLRAETRTWDAEGNESRRTVTVDAANKLVTVATTRPGMASAATEVSLNGYIISTTGHDGLTYSQSYDALGRVKKVKDPRTGEPGGANVSVSYIANTTLPYQRFDAAGRRLSTTTYDTAGRPTFMQDAGTGTTRISYNARGQLEYRWGSGGYPVSYVYDDYGQRTKQRTYRDPSNSVANMWEAGTWPGGSATAQETGWEFDDYTGLLRKKYEATEQPLAGDRTFTEYTYNTRGQTVNRYWARTIVSGANAGQRVTTTFDYFDGTGELKNITYNDGTPTVSYEVPSGQQAYTRLGQPRKITDATGARTFDYDATAPWRLTAENLDATFYAGRKLQSLYEAATDLNTGNSSYTGHTISRVKGRYAGYRLGTAPTDTAYDVQALYAGSNAGRFAGLVASRAGGGATRQFVYGYETNSALVNGLAIVGSAFQVARTFEGDRDLLASVETKWGGVSRAKFSYTHTNLWQRATSVQTGDVFADLGATHQRFAYNSRGELTQAYAYNGSDAASTTAPLDARLHDYDYDAIGNRKSANSSGNAALKDNFTADGKNRYSSRENNTLAVTGTAASGAKVAVAASPTPSAGGQALAGRPTGGTHWGTNLAVANSGSPVGGSVTAYAALAGGGPGGADLFRIESKLAFLPQAAQAFQYDADGNLTHDGVWSYAWDAENRLIRMTPTNAAISFGGRPNLELQFTYDHRHRRVAKIVITPGASTPVSERRYVYDGWNVIAETDAAGALKRSFAWGLGLGDTLTGAGGVGALLELHDHDLNKTMFPSYDGNGNLVALLNASSGAVEASYEYSPFGELLRSFGAYAQANPFRFSTKWQDEESGLIYYGFRYYSPREGRFINRDPIAEDGGLNLYGFCGNDGVNKLDYLGQKSFLSKFWNKFRHTIISAVLYVIPYVGPYLSAAYNAGVGYHYGGVMGGIVSLAGSGYLGSYAERAASLYGMYSTFKNGNFGQNFINWYANSLVSNASYQLADWAINGSQPAPGQVAVGSDPEIDKSHLLEHIGTFADRNAMDSFLSDRKLDQYGSGFFAAIRDGDQWSLYKTDGIYTKLTYVNGIQGFLGRHMSLGLAHLSARFSGFDQFTIAHNRSHGPVMDILEAGGDLLGIPSKSARLLAGALENAAKAGRETTLVAHSQGFATTLKAMRILAARGVDTSGLTIYPHAGAANSFQAAAAANGIGARLMKHAFSSYDLVPNLVGMNANPVQALGALVGLPRLFSPSERVSPHTVPNGSPQAPWYLWGPGN